MTLRSNLLALCLTSLVAFPAHGCHHPLRVGWDDWPPYHFRNAKGEMQGFAVEVLQSVVKEMGCAVHFRERPWKRQLLELQSGEADIAMEAYYNDERAKYAYFSESYSPRTSNLWIRKNTSIQASNIGELMDKGLLLGVTRNFYYGPEIQKRLSAPNINAVQSEQTNYHKLQKKRIDGFLGDWLATTWGLKQQGLENEIVRSTLPVYSAPAFFMISKKTLSSQFVSRFNQALEKIKQEGLYQQILDKYTKVN
ncbi:MAG: amino acid ABC transporter substrate-binding protein [Aeromonadaceae bacterium]|nr:amino acid ABC transporter substrate-binding protein [Aeromonadaceae bacterium]